MEGGFTLEGMIVDGEAAHLGRKMRLSEQLGENSAHLSRKTELSEQLGKNSAHLSFEIGVSEQPW